MMHPRPTNPFVEFKREDIAQSIPERFEQQVARYSQRTAVKSAGREVTYDHLNRTANRIARRLVASRGPAPEPITLLLDPDWRMIAAMFGVLKAGKFFVPLDLSHPPRRITDLLQDSQAALHLTSTQALRSAAECKLDEHRLISIDEIDPALSGDNLGLPPPPAALAHVLYTSGSTGRPKGVMQTHRHVLNSVWWHTNSRHISSEDRFSLLSPLAHTSGVADVFRALLNGACLLPYSLQEEGLSHLAAWLARERVTIYHSIPAVFRNLAQTLRGRDSLPDLRLIVLGGEPVSKQDVALYHAHFPPDCLLLNNLGSTEAGTYREIYVDHQTSVSGNTLPSGYAISDKDVLLFDEAGRQVGEGQAGQIAVRSRYLSPGYWRQPALTARFFQPSPGGGEEQIYLTGDCGRMAADGCLIYMGRNDLQIKVRGHRIELAEVEAALLGLDAVRETAVIARQTQPGEHTLAAYVVPQNGSAVDGRALRHALAGILPPFMLPADFLMMTSLPRTPTGKLDRKALTQLAPPGGRSQPNPQQPPTQVEQRLATIWADTVGVGEVGADDDFFDAGGDSLLAMRIVGRILDQLQVDLPPTALFDARTVRELAVVVTSKLLAQSKHDPLIDLLDDGELLMARTSETVRGLPSQGGYQPSRDGQTVGEN